MNHEQPKLPYDEQAPHQVPEIPVRVSRPATPVDLPRRRAQLGSLAMTPEQMAAAPPPGPIQVDTGYNNPAYSRAANRVQAAADGAFARSTMRRNTRGRGPRR